MKKNIGLLVSTMNNGGAERVVSRLSEILFNEYNIYIILYEDTYMKYECFGEVANMDIKSKNKNILSKCYLGVRRVRKLKKLKEQLKLDLVISFLDSPNIVNILSKVQSCKTFVSVRNYSNKENKSSVTTRIVDFIMKYLYRKADKIIPVSKVIACNLAQHYNVPEEKIHTIYNPYRIDEIQTLENDALEPEYIEFMSSGQIIISVGRLMYQKGFWHLIKAFKIVHDFNPQSKLVIIGKGEQNELVKNLVDDLNLTESVLLVGYHKNPFKFIKYSNVYVLSSMFEGFPNALVEAMACGCPTIAADCKSGPREILYKESDISKVAKDIEFADFGILVPPLNEEENWNENIIEDCEKKLCEAILDILNDKKLQVEFTIKAIYRAGDFDYERCKNEFIKIIEE